MTEFEARLWAQMVVDRYISRGHVMTGDKGPLAAFCDMLDLLVAAFMECDERPSEYRK